MRRYLVGALLIATSSVIGLSAPPAGAQTTPSCTGVLSGANGPLVKSLAGVVNNGNGTFTLTFRLASAHNPPLNGSYRIRDCVFVDAGGDNAYNGEPLISTDEKDVLIFGGSATVSVTVTATTSDTICDRAAISGTDPAGAGFTDKSNVLCTPLTQQPPVPEVPFAILLPLAAAVLFAGAWAIRRRRENTLAPGA